MVEAVKHVAHLREYIAAVLAPLVAGIPEDVQLNVKQLLKLQPHTRTLQLLGVLRIVNTPQGLIARHQVKLLSHEVGQRLANGRLQHLEQHLRQTFYGSRVQASLLHLLRSVVVGLHTHRRQFQFLCCVDVRMGDVDASVIDVRPSENDVFLADGVVLLGIFAAIEPRQVHHLATSIGKMGHDAFLAGTHLKGLETQYMPLHLHERHIARQFADAVEPAAIDMLVWVVFQQVAKRLDTQLIVEHLLPAWTYSRQVLYVLLQNSVHPISTSAIFKS